MKKILPVLLLAAFAPGCNSTTARGALRIAQAIMSAYSFHATGAAEGELAFNSEYIAVDASVDVVLTYRGPSGDVPGAPVEVLWRTEVQRGSGQRAYRAVFGHDNQFLAVVPVSWAEARAALPWLAAPEGDDDA